MFWCEKATIRKLVRLRNKNGAIKKRSKNFHFFSASKKQMETHVCGLLIQNGAKKACQRFRTKIVRERVLFMAYLLYFSANKFSYRKSIVFATTFY